MENEKNYSCCDPSDANCTASNCKHNRGVTCDVKNCCFHDGESYCTASKISVGPSFASSCTDTVCATFKSK